MLFHSSDWMPYSSSQRLAVFSHKNMKHNTGTHNNVELFSLHRYVDIECHSFTICSSGVPLFSWERSFFCACVRNLIPAIPLYERIVVRARNVFVLYILSKLRKLSYFTTHFCFKTKFSLPVFPLTIHQLLHKNYRKCYKN